MTHVQINTNYHPMLNGFGLPFRLRGARPFDIKDSIKTYQVGEEKLVTVKRQQENFDIACKADPGWLMYVCANTILDRAKHVAANVMMHYFMKDRKTQWIVNIDSVKQINFSQLSLVVIDSIFFDSSPYRRDKIYELINYNCNVPNLSVLVIGQNTDPLAMANQLGLRPNLAVLLK